MGWIEFPNCPNCGCAPGGCVCSSCLACELARYPCEWEMNEGGFADGVEPCSRLNGPHRLAMGGFNCQWEKVTPDVSLLLRVSYNPNTNRLEGTLTIRRPGGGLIYRNVNWNCSAANVMTLLGGPGLCGAAPATVTLRPVALDCQNDPCNTCPTRPNRARLQIVESACQDFDGLSVFSTQYNPIENRYYFPDIVGRNGALIESPTLHCCRQSPLPEHGCNNPNQIVWAVGAGRVLAHVEPDCTELASSAPFGECSSFFCANQVLTHYRCNPWYTRVFGTTTGIAFVFTSGDE